MTAPPAPPPCGTRLPAGRWCALLAGHRGLHTAAGCAHRWDADCRLFGAHGCDQPPTHPGPCRCRCGATTTRKDT